MENLLLIIVSVLAIGLFTAIGILLWLGHRYLKLKESQSNPSSNSPVIPRVLPKAGADILKALKSQGSKSFYCVDHPDMIAVGQCAISGESYCEHCIADQKDIKLAKKYIDLYLESDWVEVLMLQNKDISQDAADRIVKVKSTLWGNQGIPIIVQGHYKIDVQSDEIEVFTVVLARQDDLDFIKKELSFIQ